MHAVNRARLHANKKHTQTSLNGSRRQVTRHDAHCALINLCVKRVGGVAVSEKYSTAVTAKSFDTKFARFVDSSTFRVS